MGKTFDLQDPAGNLLSGSIPEAGGRMSQRAKASPAGGWAVKTASASMEKAKAEAKAKAEEDARAKDAEPKPEDVARAWEQAGRPQPPAGCKFDRAYVETKSKRIQVLMQPSVHARIQAKAEESGVSVNEMISRLVVLGLEAMKG